MVNKTWLEREKSSDVIWSNDGESPKYDFLA
jgi:hypothetical protein